MSPAPFDQQGIAYLPDLLSAAECAAATDQLSAVDGAGSRTLLAQPWCQALAARLRQQPALAPLLLPAAVAVQCTYFAKSLARNWLVALHQDLSIPVAARVEDAAWHGWSVKEGQLFVQAPADVLAQLVAVRVHLDACTAADGALRVIPGSHRHGVLDAPAILAQRQATAELVCTAARGAAWVMRPLLLHASSKASGTSQRRVLHFLWGPRHLPAGLQWAAVAPPGAGLTTSTCAPS